MKHIEWIKWHGLMCCKVLFFMLCCFLYSIANADSWLALRDGWLHPIKDGQVCPTYFLFAPGWLQNETAVVRYCGSTVLPAGISVQWPSTFCTVHPQFVQSVRFSEFSDDVPYSMSGWAGCVLLKAIRKLRNASERIYTRPTSALCPTVHHYMNLPAGAMDVQLLAQSYDELCKQIPSKSDVVLYGFSRGATAALVFLATYYGLCNDKRIRAVVLEAPFVGVKSLVETVFPLWCSFFAEDSLSLLVQATFDEVAAMSALEALEYIDSSLPLLFVTSTADEIVPCKHVQRLYEHFSCGNALDSDLLRLSKSPHTRYMITDSVDTALYYHTVHQWYYSHGCSYRAIGMK